MSWIVENALWIAVAAAGIAVLGLTNRTRGLAARLCTFAGGIGLTAVGAGAFVADIRWAVDLAAVLLGRHL